MLDFHVMVLKTRKISGFQHSKDFVHTVKVGEEERRELRRKSAPDHCLLSLEQQYRVNLSAPCSSVQPGRLFSRQDLTETLLHSNLIQTHGQIDT